MRTKIYLNAKAVIQEFVEDVFEKHIYGLLNEAISIIIRDITVKKR